MNTRGEARNGMTMAFSVSFNRSRTSFVIAHDGGFSVFQTEDGDKISSSNSPPLRQASMIGESRYVTLASLFGNQPGMADFDVAVYDAQDENMVVKLDELRDVRAAHMTEHRLIVVCRNAVYLYNTEDFSQISALDTFVNDAGVCSIGATKVVIPGRSSGQIQVVDLKTGRAQQIITAHLSAIKAVELSEDEKYVATASDNGTLFRIFLLPDGNKVAELRRSIETANVLDIKMSPNNAYLASTSEKGTLHIFSLGEEPAEQPTSYTPGSRDSGSPEPIPIQVPRKGSMSSSPNPSARVASSSFSPGSPSRKGSVPSRMLAGSPAEYVMVDPSPPRSKETARSLGSGKYSQLSKLPFAPSFIKAHYPDASSDFDVGPINAAATAQNIPGLPTRGQIKWLDEETFVVVRVQPKAFWEKFRVEKSALDGRLEVNRTAYTPLPIP